MSRWFVGSSSSRQFAPSQHQQQQLQPRPLAAGERLERPAHLLVREQELHQPRDGLALGDRRGVPHELRAASPSGRRAGGPARGGRSESTGRPCARPRPARARPRAHGAAPTCRRRSRRRRRRARRAAPSGRRRRGSDCRRARRRRRTARRRARRRARAAAGRARSCAARARAGRSSPCGRSAAACCAPA